MYLTPCLARHLLAMRDNRGPEAFRAEFEAYRGPHSTACKESDDVGALPVFPDQS